MICNNTTGVIERLVEPFIGIGAHGRLDSKPCVNFITPRCVGQKMSILLTYDTVILWSFLYLHWAENRRHEGQDGDGIRND